MAVTHPLVEDLQRFRDEAFRGTVEVIRERYPEYDSADIPLLVRTIVEAFEEHDELRYWAADILVACREYLDAWDAEPAGDTQSAQIARRNLRESSDAVERARNRMRAHVAWSSRPQGEGRL